MSRACLAVLIAAAALLPGCGSGRRDWRIPPCVDETSESCRVGHVSVDGRSRSFVLTPPAPDRCAAGSLPIVFAWHGSGGNGAQLRSYLGLESVLAGQAVVVYPDGLPRDDTGGFAGWNRDPDGDDLRFFDALLDVLGGDPCLDASRVFSVGHSRGGRFVEVLACERAANHRAVALIATGIRNVGRCPGRPPIWIAHGRSDATVGFWQGRWLRSAWADRNGCDPVRFFDRFDDGRCAELPGCPSASPVVWCPHDESLWDGHGIPSFAPAEIWRFFESIDERGPPAPEAIPREERAG